MPHFEGIVETGGGARLDVYIASSLGLLTRSQLKTRNLTAEVNGKAVKRSFPVKTGDRILLRWDDPPLTALLPENIPLTILYEDDDCVVINKQQGIVVHPGAGNRQGTVANALLGRRSSLQEKPPRIDEDGAGCRPFIVHRLDKDTSGVLIAAWNEDALRFLATQFKERTVRKTYAAIVRGAPPLERGVIDTLIARDRRNRKLFTVDTLRGKRAITRYRLLHSWEDGGEVRSLLALYPRTGRTHQIRVHLRHAGCPVLGDPLYGTQRGGGGVMLMLHALSLEITLPGGGRRKFKTKLPERFKLCFSSAKVQ